MGIENKGIGLWSNIFSLLIPINSNKDDGGDTSEGFEESAAPDAVCRLGRKLD